MLFSISVETGHAASKKDLPPAPTEGTPSRDLRHGVGEIKRGEVSTQSTQYLMNGECYINLNSGTIVTIGGKTSAYSSVDTVAVDLYLQRWDSSKGQWVDVIHVDEFKDYNASIVTGSKDVNVVSGYYYRTRAHHWVNEGDVVEQNNSVSSYIYVK